VNRGLPPQPDFENVVIYVFNVCDCVSVVGTSPKWSWDRKGKPNQRRPLSGGIMANNFKIIGRIEAEHIDNKRIVISTDKQGSITINRVPYRVRAGYEVKEDGAWHLVGAEIERIGWFINDTKIAGNLPPPTDKARAKLEDYLENHVRTELNRVGPDKINEALHPDHQDE
jgi:hypothetical protein